MSIAKRKVCAEFVGNRSKFATILDKLINSYEKDSKSVPRTNYNALFMVPDLDQTVILILMYL